MIIEKGVVQFVRLPMSIGLSFALAGIMFLAGCTASSPQVELGSTPMTKAEAITGPTRSGFDLQGHRGARGLRPENTLPAFEYALDVGVTTLELDLHLSKDGILVVAHDDFIDSKCHLAGEHEPVATRLQISQLTLEAIKRYRCDLNPDPDKFPEQLAQAMPLAGDNYAIPTLEEVFQFVEAYAQSNLKTDAQRQRASVARFNIETKRKANKPDLIGDDFNGETPGQFEQEIVKLIEQYNLFDRAVIQSFDHRSINVIPQLNQDIATVALTSKAVNPARLSQETTAAIWSPNHTTLSLKSIEAAHEAGLLVIPWTVNDAARMEELIEWGVDGIITDYPDVLAEILIAQNITY